MADTRRPGRVLPAGRGLRADLVFTHISAKLPGPDEQFLINPYGALLKEITASSLVKVDAPRAPSRRLAVSGESGGLHHSQRGARRAPRRALRVAYAYGQRHRCSGAAGQAYCRSRSKSIFVLSSLGYHDYEGVARCDDEKPRLVADLGSRTFLMLRNHGLLTVGAALPTPSWRCICSKPRVRSNWRAVRRGRTGDSSPANPRNCAGASGTGHAQSRRSPGVAGTAQACRMDSSYRD